MSEFRMPSLGADMETGILVEWLVQPGATVDRGDLVAVVETQKGQIDVEIFDAGVITKILVAEGEEVPVGTPLAIVNGERPGARQSPEAEPTTPATESESEESGDSEPVAAASRGRSTSVAGDRLRVSPAARRLASDEGIDLHTVQGTRPGGAISLLDVRRAINQRVPEPEPSRPDRLSEMRKAIAASMARSKREIPHYYLGHEIDMARSAAWLEAENSQRTVKDRLVYAALLIKAVAIAVHDVPEMNGFWKDGHFEERHDVHVGIAISLRGGGLVAPGIHDTDKKSIDEIMNSLRDLVQRARAGRLRSSEISEPTITVTNLGEQTVDQVFGVIYPPQVALVGFGTLADRARVVNGGIFVRPTVAASLSGDHRASSGHRGAQFLATIDRLLQEPVKL